MSATGGAFIAGGNRSRNRYLDENRFYSPPPFRKHREKQQEQQRSSQEQQRSSLSRTSSDNRPGSSSDCSISSRTTSDISNLDRFLECITPLVPAQYLPKRNSRRWKTREAELHQYFVLGDLWESFKESSAYGAGVPLVYGNESITQYYNVSLSAIQLYIDPSKPSARLTKPSQESDSESARETSSDSNNGCCHERGVKSVNGGSINHFSVLDACSLDLERVSLSKPSMGLSSDQTESCNPPGQLIFQYFEHDSPYNRLPLADKISDLARQFPELKTYWSCDLSPASWVSLAWYPIYRIPTGPTLQSLSACFLTYHSLSTALQSPNSDALHIHYSRGRDISSKLSLPIFGLAFHKFKVSVWDPDGVSECQKANSLLQAAANWLRLLRVDHHDYNYFISHSTHLL